MQPNISCVACLGFLEQYMHDGGQVIEQVPTDSNCSIKPLSSYLYAICFLTLPLLYLDFH